MYNYSVGTDFGDDSSVEETADRPLPASCNLRGMPTVAFCFLAGCATLVAEGCCAPLSVPTSVMAVAWSLATVSTAAEGAAYCARNKNIALLQPEQQPLQQSKPSTVSTQPESQNTFGR